MKMKSLKILSAITIALFVLGTTLYAQGTDSRIGSIARERVDHGATKLRRSPKQRLKKSIRCGEGVTPPVSEILMIRRELL